MRFRSALASRRVAALTVLAVVAIAVAVTLSLVLRDGEVPAPTDGIGDIPAAHLVPEDAALYVALGSDLDSDAWRAAFALLERLGFDDPLGRIRESLGDESGVVWDEEVAPFLGGAAVLFLSGPGDADGGGAVIFHASDAKAAEAVILQRRGDGFGERAYRDVPYKVMEKGGVLAVLGEHFVYATDEATVRDVIEARFGETRPLADSGDFRRLRNALEGDALAFVYLRPLALLADAMEQPREGDADAPEAASGLLSALGLDGLLAEPIGLVVRADGGAFRVEAALLGDPKPVASILRPRESRFATMVPAETAVFVSAYDLAGLVEDLFGGGGIQQRLRGAVLDSAAGEGGELGELARLEDVLALLTGETALAIWFADGGATGEFVLLAEVEDEERAREALAALLGDALATGDAALSVADGVAAFGTSAAAIEAVRGGGPALADTKRYAGAVARLDAPLATFAYVDVPALFASGMDELGGLDLDGDALGLIVNLTWEDGRARVEAALTVAPAD